MTQNTKQQTVICDHLAFTVPLANFQHLNRAGSELNHLWQKMPKKTWNKKTPQVQKDRLLESYNHECTEVLFKRMTEFLFHILGLKVSASLNKGFYGYNDCHTIYDSKGTVSLGFIGIGGNSNTVYFQISGQGCQHVFDKVTPFILHFWLSKVLTVDKLGRLDLAYDCFDDNFTCDYANLAYKDLAFKNPKGGRNPMHSYKPDYMGDELVGEITRIGKRDSPVHWRIYNKALQMGIVDQSWYRSEVELKKINVDSLLDFDGTFAGLNAFSASFTFCEGISVRNAVKRVRLDFAGRIRWVKRQCGRTISDVIELFGGDVHLALGALCDERGGKFILPNTQSILLNEHVHKHLHVLSPMPLAVNVNRVVTDMKVKLVAPNNRLLPFNPQRTAFNQVPSGLNVSLKETKFNGQRCSSGSAYSAFSIDSNALPTATQDKVVLDDLCCTTKPVQHPTFSVEPQELSSHPFVDLFAKHTGDSVLCTTCQTFKKPKKLGKLEVCAHCSHEITANYKLNNVSLTF